ncbi:MAG: hypothetical protein M5U14_01965 [Acidimicrobiia bacterium]|nr:hypothetical protein [Acidimicrobiia bacterium]
MAARRSPPRREPASRRTRARSTARPPGRWSRTREAAASQLGGHAADAVAIALVVLAVLSALGLASDLADPVGSALASGAGALLGHGDVLVPLAAAGLAVALLRPRRDDPEVAPAGLRVGVGTALVLVGVVGLLHLAGGARRCRGRSRICATPAGWWEPRRPPRFGPPEAWSAPSWSWWASGSSAR